MASLATKNRYSKHQPSPKGRTSACLCKNSRDTHQVSDVLPFQIKRCGIGRDVMPFGARAGGAEAKCRSAERLGTRRHRAATCMAARRQALVAVVASVAAATATCLDSCASCDAVAWHVVTKVTASPAFCKVRFLGIESVLTCLLLGRARGCWQQNPGYLHARLVITQN